MAEQEPIEVKIARIEEHQKSIDEHMKSIDETLKKQVMLRHVNKDGICDAYVTVVEHDRTLNQWEKDVEKIEDHEKRINQWTGALGAVAFFCSLIGGFIGVLIAKVWK